MGESNVVFIYKEFFDSSQVPFSKIELDSVIKRNLKESFLKAGGVRIVAIDYGPQERWRISYWSSRTGYGAWLEDGTLREYFEKRQQYNEMHKIRTDLLGPFDAWELVHA